MKYKKRLANLAAAQKAFDNQKNKQGFRRPGSQKGKI